MLLDLIKILNLKSFFTSKNSLHATTKEFSCDWEICNTPPQSCEGSKEYKRVTDVKEFLIHTYLADYMAYKPKGKIKGELILSNGFTNAFGKPSCSAELIIDLYDVNLLTQKGFKLFEQIEGKVDIRFLYPTLTYEIAESNRLTLEQKKQLFMKWTKDPFRCALTRAINENNIFDEATAKASREYMLASCIQFNKSTKTLSVNIKDFRAYLKNREYAPYPIEIGKTLGLNTSASSEEQGEEREKETAPFVYLEQLIPLTPEAKVTVPIDQFSCINDLPFSAIAVGEKPPINSDWANESGSTPVHMTLFCSMGEEMVVNSSSILYLYTDLVCKTTAPLSISGSNQNFAFLSSEIVRALTRSFDTPGSPTNLSYGGKSIFTVTDEREKNRQLAFLKLAALSACPIGYRNNSTKFLGARIYNHFVIPKKKKHGYRIISAPRYTAKVWNDAVKNLLELGTANSRSLAETAKKHSLKILSYSRGKDYIKEISDMNLNMGAGRFMLSVDLKDFFLNITPQMIPLILQEFGELKIKITELVKSDWFLLKSDIIEYLKLIKGIKSIDTEQGPSIFATDLKDITLEGDTREISVMFLIALISYNELFNSNLKNVHRGFFRTMFPEATPRSGATKDYLMAAIILKLLFVNIPIKKLWDSFEKDLSGFENHTAPFKLAIPQGASYSGIIANMVSAKLVTIFLKRWESIFNLIPGQYCQTIIYSDNIYIFFNLDNPSKENITAFTSYSKRQLKNLPFADKLIRDGKISVVDRTTTPALKILGLLLDSEGKIRLSRKRIRKVNQMRIREFHAANGVSENSYISSKERGSYNYCMHVRKHSPDTRKLFLEQLITKRGETK